MTNSVLVTRADYEALIRARGFTKKQVEICELLWKPRVLMFMRPHGVSHWRKRFRGLRRELQRRSPRQTQIVLSFENKNLVTRYVFLGKVAAL